MMPSRIRRLFRAVRVCIVPSLARHAQYRFALHSWMTLPDIDALTRVLASQRFSQQLAPQLVGGPSVQRVLVFAPHPDDETFGAGGMLLQLLRRGVSVHVVYVTSGERDPDGADARIREREVATIAAARGITVECWRYPSHDIPITTESVERLRAVVAREEPEAIVLPFFADDHEDHRRTALLFAAAFRDGDLDAEVWAYQVYSTVLPNVVVDITDEMDAKDAWMRQWAFEHRTRNWAHYVRGMNAIACRWLSTAEARYAEPYFVVSATEYVALCDQYRVALPDQ